MKTKLLRLIKILLASVSAAVVIATAVPPSAHALDAGDLLSYFVDELTPYGRWNNVSQYGQVWEPYDQDERDWRPYSEGHWVFSEEYGWVWKPEEKWGEVAYHYGRWTNSNNRWFWVPDKTWGPAWVDWRSNDEYIGWAPLQPDAYWSGDGDWQPRSSYFSSAPSHYVTIPQRYFGESNFRRYIVAPSRNITVLNRAQDITRYRTVERRVRNEGPRREVLERVIGRRIQPVRYVQPVIQRRQLPAARAGRKNDDEAREHDERARFANQAQKHESERAQNEGKAKHQPNKHQNRPEAKGQKLKQNDDARQLHNREQPKKAAKAHPGKKVQNEHQNKKQGDGDREQKAARQSGEKTDKGHAAKGKQKGAKANKDDKGNKDGKKNHTGGKS